MTLFKPKIGWIKWVNPYEENEDKDDNFEKSPELYEDDDIDEDCTSTQKTIPTKAVLTPMGMVPLPEHSATQKVFNLWTAHTNFDINNSICSIVEKTIGVETLDIFTRYRMRVGIGKMFSTKDTIDRINQNIYASFNQDVQHDNSIH